MVRPACQKWPIRCRGKVWSFLIKYSTIHMVGFLANYVAWKWESLEPQCQEGHRGGAREMVFFFLLPPSSYNGKEMQQRAEQLCPQTRTDKCTCLVVGRQEADWAVLPLITLICEWLETTNFGFPSFACCFDVKEGPSSKFWNKCRTMSHMEFIVVVVLPRRQNRP